MHSCASYRVSNRVTCSGTDVRMHTCTGEGCRGRQLPRQDRCPGDGFLGWPSVMVTFVEVLSKGLGYARKEVTIIHLSTGCRIIDRIQYQPSGDGGTRSPPAMPATPICLLDPKCSSGSGKRLNLRLFDPPINFRKTSFFIQPFLL